MKPPPATFYRYFPISQRDENWGLYVTTAGESRVTPHSPYPLGVHPDGYAFGWRQGRVLDSFALLYVSSGRGKFESRGISTVIEPGHAFLLFPGVRHRYAPAPETGWHEHWLGFDGEIPRRWMKHKFISPKKPV